MTTLGEVLTRIRTALDLLRPDELAVAADQLRDEVLPTLAQLAQESNRPELADALTLVAEVPDDLDRAAQLFREAINKGEHYIDRQGGTGSTTVVTPPPGAVVAPPHPAPGPTVDPALIAEVQRAGAKISPDRVVHIGRDQSGRIIWLEEGDKRSGVYHLTRDERVQDFAREGICAEDIIDVVWRVSLGGKSIGRVGQDGAAYSVDYHGARKTIVVVVASNGYIVTAYPLYSNRKVELF